MFARVTTTEFSPYRIDEAIHTVFQNPFETFSPLRRADPPDVQVERRLLKCYLYTEHAELASAGK